MRAVLSSLVVFASLACSTPIAGSDSGASDAGDRPDVGASDAPGDAGTVLPVAGWLVGFGGGGFDAATSVVANATRIAVAGYYDGDQSFFGTNIAGQRNVFVALLAADGTLLWVRTVGGTSIDEASSVALDAAGNVYVGGSFSLTVDFDPGAAVNNRTASGVDVTTDAFVLSLDPTGAFRWVTTFGSDQFDGVEGLAVDSTRSRVYAVGAIQGATDFGDGLVLLEPGAALDGFVVALGAANGAHTWNRTLRATDGAQLRGLAVAPNGDVLVAGTASASIMVTATPTLLSNVAAIVLRLDAENRALWVHPYEGAGGFTRSCSRVLVAPGGETYLGCTFDGPLAAGSFSADTVGSVDACVLRLDAAGLVDWGLVLAGPTGNEAIGGLALDVDGSLWVAGTDTTATFGGVSLPSVLGNDVFLARVLTTAATGTVTAPARGIGTTGADLAVGLALGEAGRPIVVGSYADVGLMAEGDGPLAHGGVSDGFVWRHAAP